MSVEKLDKVLNTFQDSIQQFMIGNGVLESEFSVTWVEFETEHGSVVVMPNISISFKKADQD